VFLMTFTCLCFSQSPGGVSTNLELWVKADTGVTGTTNVSQWDDNSVNANHATNATVSLQPSLVDNAVNFNPAIDFDGADDVLRGPANTGGYTHSYFVVYENDDLINNATTAQGLFTFNCSTGTLSAGICNGPNATAGLYLGGYTSSFPDEIITHSTGASTEWWTAQTGTASYAAGTKQIVSVNTNIGGTDHEIQRNGTNIGNANTGLFRNLSDALYRIGYGQVDTPGVTFPFDGKISEVINFSSRVSDLERQRIESYLAIKYGITNSTAYLAADGSTIWAVDPTYNSNIFGIGNEVAQALDQQISKSVNTGAILTLSTDTDFATANGTHTSLTDGQFLVIGNDGNATAIQTTELDLTSGLNVRIGREWKVANTSSVGAINMQFDGFDNTWSLITTTDGDFSAGITTIGTLSASGTITTTLADGVTFTLAKSVVSPGGVSTALELWMKADVETYSDNGITQAIDDEFVWEWGDQSVNNLNATGGAGNRPTFQDDTTNRINFNPVTQWDTSGSGNLALNTGSSLNIGGTTEHEIMFVGKTPTSSNQQTIISSSATNGLQLRVSNTGTMQLLRSGVELVATGTTDTRDGLPHIGGVSRSVNQFDISLDGSIDGNNTSTPNFGSGAANIGNRAWSGSPNYENYEGNLGELIVYSSALSTTGKQKVQSYLALKYGITLNNGATAYLAASGSSVWDVDPTYNSDVFGIANDVLQVLDQQISKSVNTGAILTLSTDTDFTSANGTHASLTDGQYLVIGNNGDAVSLQATEIDVVVYPQRTAREWKVQNTSAIGAVNLKFDGFDNTYYVIVDADGDFSSGATTLGQLNASGELTGVALTDGQYFTLATLNTADTDGDGIENWSDADADGNGTVDNGVDTDGDGITDAAESANGTDPINMDSDGDGIPDGADVDSGANSNTDTDGDGVQDGGDVDNTTATNNTDTDGDGIIDIVDPLDNTDPVDTDGDGIPDIADVDPTGTGTPLNGSDSDGDGISDAADSDDSPNDGTIDAGNTDSDGDGIDDAYDPQDNSDTDGDGIENWSDADADGNGTVDNGVDTDGDGITDAAESANGTDPINMDSDGDGIPDGADVDSGANSNTDTDGDGVQDGGDVDNTTATNNTDTDGDGIIDIVDPLDNTDPVDTDGDGIPDIADVDPTGTGTPLNGSDSDGDGISDAADSDDSPNDGTTDVGNTDTDGNGIDDAFDPNLLSTNDVTLSDSEIILYPNPVQDVLNIKFANATNKADVVIYNVAGQRVYQAVLNNMIGNEANVDISKMSSGLYLVKITTDVGYITKRLEKK